MNRSRRDRRPTVQPKPKPRLSCSTTNHPDCARLGEKVLRILASWLRRCSRRRRESRSAWRRREAHQPAASSQQPAGGSWQPTREAPPEARRGAAFGLSAARELTRRNDDAADDERRRAENKHLRGPSKERRRRRDPIFAERSFSFQPKRDRRAHDDRSASSGASESEELRTLPFHLKRAPSRVLLASDAARNFCPRRRRSECKSERVSRAPS